MDFEPVLNHLATLGETGRSTVEFIRQHKTRLGFQRQGKATGAKWTLCGNIYLSPRLFSAETPFDHPGMLSMIVHETVHLRQGFWKALSIYGELEAWQTGFAFHVEITSKRPGPLTTAILNLPLGWDREVLRQARTLMRKYAGKKYRADLLPLYPLHRELWYLITRKTP